jgi:hypothetical protein
MKPSHKPNLAVVESKPADQVRCKRDIGSPADFVMRAMEGAGVSGLGNIKNTFLTDPGVSTPVTMSPDGSYFSVAGDVREGFLVVDSFEGHHRGWTFSTKGGALSQVYAIASTFERGQVLESETAMSITGASPAGERTLFVSSLD